jgi:choline-glycine betaine transporter
MNDNSFYGIFAVLMFGILSAIGTIVFSVALLIAMLSKIKNQRPMKAQRSFGYLLGSLVPFTTGLIFMYLVAAIDDATTRKAFDDFGCFIVMVIAFAVMIYIGNRGRRRPV